MNNLKIKTFTFEDNCVFNYNRRYENENTRGCHEYYYTEKSYIIDDAINMFLKYNNIEIVDIKINNIVKGNNPPTSILIYTIVYKELDVKGVNDYEDD